MSQPDSIPEDHYMQVAREWGNRIVTGDYEAELAALLRSEFPPLCERVEVLVNAEFNKLEAERDQLQHQLASSETVGRAAGKLCGEYLQEIAAAESRGIRLQRQLEQERSKSREYHRRIQSLQSELYKKEGGNTWHGYFKAAMSLWKQSQEALERTRRQLEQMRKLSKYAKHKLGCGGNYGIGRCTCGLAELLKETEG